MTNQPTREALVEAIKAAIVAQHDPAYSYVSKVSVGDVELDGSFEIEPIADAALSILSTALAERDARIAELEAVVSEMVTAIDESRGGVGNFYPEVVFDKLPDGWLKRARAKLKESERG